VPQPVPMTENTNWSSWSAHVAHGWSDHATTAKPTHDIHTEAGASGRQRKNAHTGDRLSNT
jgi:hypothetical protein